MEKVIQDGPRWPKMAQDGPEMAQDGPRRARDGPKMGPRWAQEGPRWAQDGPKMAQDGLKMGSQRPSNIEVEKGSAWPKDPGPPGPVFGVSWGSIGAS